MNIGDRVRIKETSCGWRGEAGRIVGIKYEVLVEIDDVIRTDGKHALVWRVFDDVAPEDT